MTEAYQRTPDATQIEWVCPCCIGKVIDRRSDGVMFIPKHETINPPLDGASWEAVHASCAEGCGWGPGETIPLRELDDVDGLLRWTAILMRHHPWITRTNWPEIVGHILDQRLSESGDTIRVDTSRVRGV